MIESEQRRVVGVSRVVAYIARIIGENKQLKNVAVRGEVSGLNQKNGRLYFDLKENADVLNCVVWSNSAAKLPPFKNGDEVIVSGDFGTYPVRSSYQLFVISLELTGIGQLYAEFEALRKKFAAEGLYDGGRKRPMPRFPQRVALVSARGKGAEDFLTTIARRAPHLEVRFIETRVQGDGAQIDIAEALDKASALDVDAVVLARGGGSYEDLFPFNREPVVRAIVRSRHPVLTAIGHTDDRHLADEVADRVAETPSNAAHYFGEIRDWYLRRIDQSRQRLVQRITDMRRLATQRFDDAAGQLVRAAREFSPSRHQRLLLLERRLSAQTPASRLAARERDLGRASSRLRALAPEYAVRRQTRLRPLEARMPDLFSAYVAKLDRNLKVAVARLEAGDPEKPLQRGYAMVYHNGKLLRDAASVSRGELVEAHLQHGTIAARVEETRDE